MVVKIGHARHNEFGKVKGGKKGDQTGKEVCITDYYVHDKGWVVIRPIDPKDAEIIASTMEAICANENFGYGQDYRLSGFNELKKVDFDPSKVHVKCGLDCSQTVRCCCHAAGIEVENFRTVSQIQTLEPTGKFKILRSKKYCESSKYLKRGDILVTKIKGHTVVVLTNGSAVKEKLKAEATYDKSKLKAAMNMSKSLVATYVTTSELNLRYGAGKNNTKILTMPKGAEVNCYGYYNMVSKTKWLLVQYGDYVGYCSKKYLKKKK